MQHLLWDSQQNRKRTGGEEQARGNTGENKRLLVSAGLGLSPHLLCLLPTLCIYCASSLCSCSVHVLFMFCTCVRATGKFKLD